MYEEMKGNVGIQVEKILKENPGMLPEDALLKLLLSILHAAINGDVTLYKDGNTYLSAVEITEPIKAAQKVSLDDYYVNVVKGKMLAGLRRNNWYLVNVDNGPPKIMSVHEMTLKDMSKRIPKEHAIQFMNAISLGSVDTDEVS